MAKTSSKQPKKVTTATEVDYSLLTEDQVDQLLTATLQALCQQLEQQGVDPDAITGALFNQFTERMADINDREQYELILESALELPWDEQTIH